MTGIVITALYATIPAFLNLGNEFMLPLDEGIIMYMPTGLHDFWITEVAKVLEAMDHEPNSFPEIERVFGKIGCSCSPNMFAGWNPAHLR